MVTTVLAWTAVAANPEAATAVKTVKRKRDLRFMD